MLCNAADGSVNGSDGTIPADDAYEKSLLYKRAAKIVCEGFRNGPLYWLIILEYVINDRLASEVAAEFDVATDYVHNVKRRVIKRLKSDFGELIE